MVLSRRRHRQGFQVQGSAPPKVLSQLSAYAPAQAALGVVERIQEADEAEVRVRMYDQIDHTWTQPIVEDQVQNFHLRKVVYLCSDCPWNSAWPEQFGAHVKQAKLQWQMHMKAEVMPVITNYGSASRCTGCNSTFQFVQRAQMHVDAMRQTGGAHEGATLSLSRRFGLEPSVSPVQSRSVPTLAQSASERTEVPHKRKRRHHRHAGRAHGN